jgi:hypothetical protein
LAWWDAELQRILQECQQTADVVPFEHAARARNAMTTVKDRFASQV